jgi:probable rRNA maturation factor
LSLSIQNRQRRVSVSLPRLRRLVSRTLSTLDRSDRDVHLTLVDDREIRRLNRRYLGARRPTDVLAFNLELGAGPASFEGPGPPARLLGEVIISAETAARQAARLRIPVALELDLLVVHGLLHLAGYDDHDPGEARVMHEREQEILSRGRRRALPARLWTGLLGEP